MATDVFGDSSLFEEFDKERLPQSSYIKKEKTENGDNADKDIVFKLDEFESDSESSGDVSENDTNDKQQQQQNSKPMESDSVHVPSSSDKTKTPLLEVNGTDDNSEEEISQPCSSCEIIAKESEKCKRFAKLLDTTRHVPVEDGPAVQVIYQNNVIARKYRSQIEGFITRLIQQDKHEGQESLPSLRLKASALSTVELNPKLSREDYDNVKTRSSHSIIGCSQMYDEFVLDTLGWPLVEHTPALTDGWEIPSYEQVYQQVFPYEEEDDDLGPRKPPPKPKSSCFNCGEGHMLSECPVPKDQSRIRQKRREFMEQSSPASLSKGLSSQNRYIDDPRFSGFKPGQISEDLREAMGMSSDQLPGYIYRMRLLGYPPGWMQDLEEHGSGITLFDKDGNEVALNGQSLEDGEMSGEEAPLPFDPAKIIEYEGFTIPVPQGKVDEHAYLNMPPIQPHQLKKNIEAMMSQNKLKRHSMDNAGHGGKRQKMDSTCEDMDFDSDYAATPNKSQSSSFASPPPLPLFTPPCNPPLPEGTPPPTPPVTQGRALSFGSADRGSSSGGSPGGGQSGSDDPSRPDAAGAGPETLEELESQYKVLMEQLASEEGEESNIIVMDSCGGSDKETEEGEISQDSESQTSEGTQVLDAEEDSSSLSSNRSVLAKPCVSIAKDYGTPILKASAFSSLPDPEKFGTGITDHIPFENLPDATGTFDKLKNILGKIRQKVSFSKKK